ncbi:MAG: VirB4 family type IV secretion system protein [Thermoplasmata archaeon]
MTAPHAPPSSESIDELRSGGLSWAPLLVPTLPTEVPFGVVGRLLPSSGQEEMWIELHRLPRDRALELLDRAGAVAEAEIASETGGAAVLERPELERVARTSRELGRRVALREQDLWKVGLLLVARGRSAAAARRLREALRRRIHALGFRPRIPSYECTGALEPPSGDGREPRPAGFWHTLHTDGAAAFFPFVEESVAEEDGILVGLLLDDASPVLLNRWAHASHSWGIFGTTGSGKSFAAALLALRSRWRYPELDIVVVDPLGEFGSWARALGGVVLEVGPDAPGRLNPLDPVTTGGDRVEKAGRVGTLVRSLFPSLRDEEVALLDRALHRLYAAGPETPTFSDLSAEVLRGGREAGRLAALLEGVTEGSLAHLDGPTTVALDGSPLVISLAGVPEDHRAFHLSYLLDAIYGRLRRADRQRLVLIDEAHLLVRSEGTAEFLDHVVRHVRHYRAGLCLMSQHPEDFLRSAAGRSILRNLRATLLLRLPSVSEECRGFFGLTRAEAEWLPRARLPREAGYSEGILRWGIGHLPIAVVASTPEYEFLARNLALPPLRPPSPTPDSPPTAPLSRPRGTGPADGR